MADAFWYLRKENPDAQIRYSEGTYRDQKVVTVFVVGEESPSRSQCDAVLAMDTEIESPVIVIPCGGLPPEGTQDDLTTARDMIFIYTPRYIDDDFYFKCTRTGGLLLIKILVDRYFHRDAAIKWVYDFDWEIALN